MSRSTRGFGPGLRGAKRWPSLRSIIAIHSGLPSGRPMVGAPLDPGRRRRVGRHGEKRRKIGDQGAQRRRRCELVILARELRPSARPWPVLATAHQPRDHRIESDVTGAANKCGSSITTAPKRPWNRWPIHRNRPRCSAGALRQRLPASHPRPPASRSGGPDRASGNKPRLLCGRGAPPRR